MEKEIRVTALTPENPSNCSIRDGIILSNEIITCSYKGIRDMVLITNKRMIIVDKQGITGKKQKYLSIPLEKISAYSVETGGTLDFDCDVEIFVSGMGYVHCEIMRPTKNLDPLVSELNRLLFS